MILDLRLPGSSGSLRILDVSNYGIAPSADTSSAADRTRRVWRFLEQMVSEIRNHSLGGLKPTAASQAWHAFRFGHLKHGVFCHDNPTALRLEEEGYYGGRCEAFRLGKIPGPVWHLDVSSMYLSVYMGEHLPSHMVRIEGQCEPAKLRELVDDHHVIARVTVCTGEPSWPMRERNLRLVVFPVGRFSTTLAGPELADALRRGAVEAVEGYSLYERQPYLLSFARAMRCLIAGQARGTDLRAWAKSLAVCVVGKLGQRDQGWTDCPFPGVYPFWGEWEHKTVQGDWIAWRSIAGRTQRKDSGQFSADAVPAAAAWITSAARLKLLWLIRCAGWAHVHYVDTDALMVDYEGYQRLEGAGYCSETEIGMLRVKGVHDSVRILGVKAYEEDGRLVQAGKPIRGRPNYPASGRVWVSMGVSAALRVGRRPEAEEALVPWSPSGAYRHGKRMPDGTVEPLRYGEEGD